MFRVLYLKQGVSLDLVIISQGNHTVLDGSRQWGEGQVPGELIAAMLYKVL
jgi:hypothetical protein